MAPDAAWLTRKRLDNQGLSRIRFRSAPEVVRWFGAAQSQDFAGAMWALGQRLEGVTVTEIERAFDAGEILRTHVMRPTWHFVAPEDIRWLLQLTGPRVLALSAYYFRKNGLDDRAVRRSRAAIERALRGGRHLTRTELGAAIRKAGIDHDGERLGNIVMHAELNAVICSGPRRGKQFTYALLEERVPQERVRDREQALEELTIRYFTSHGPATVRDFSWWSGLSMKDARAGLAMLGQKVERVAIEGLDYWVVPSRTGRRAPAPLVHLLPNYDEGLIAYKDRDMPGGLPAPAGAARHGNFPHHLVIEGRLLGRWRRNLTARGVAVDALPYRVLTRAEARSLDAMVARHGEFMGMPARSVLLDSGA